MRERGACGAIATHTMSLRDVVDSSVRISQPLIILSTTQDALRTVSLASSFPILFHSFGLLLSISSLFYFSQLDLFEIALVAMCVHAYEVCANKMAFKVVQNAMATGS